MKLPTSLALSALFCGLAVSSAPVELGSSVLHATASPGLAQDSAQEFRSLFREALKAHATNEMEKLMRSRKDDAILTVMLVCVSIAERPSDALEEEIQGLRKTWKTVYKTSFVNKQYEYFSLIKPNFKRTRLQLTEAYDKTYPIFDKARGEKNDGVLAQCYDQFSSQADGFQKVGDTYMASLAWYFAAQAIDQPYRGDEADLYAACAAWTSSFENRLKAGLEDQLYQWAKDRSDELTASGFDDPEKAAGLAAAAAADAAALAVRLTPTFELVEDIAAVRRPHYSADDIYQMWEAIALLGNGSTKKIQTMPDSPTVIRDGAVKVSMDVDGDGEGDIPIPVTGNISPIRFTIGQGEEEREVAMLATIGLQDDIYQGFRQNLGPDENQLAIYFAPAGSMVTDLNGTSLRIFDDNLDGVYGSLGPQVRTWGFLGCRTGSFQPDMDSIQIGNAKKALPFSELIQVEDAWYRLAIEQNGKSLVVTPAADVRTGTLKLKLKGLKADYLVLHGVGSMENVYIDVTANGAKGVEAPVGTYSLFSGRVSKGKRQQTMKALILPGSSMDNFVVRAGEVTQLEFGAPFGFVFEYTQDDDTVSVDGFTVSISGKAGETYQRLWNCVPIVDVLVRKVGAKKGVDIGGMRPTESSEEVFDNGYQTAWFPMAEPKEKGKYKGHDVEVRLYQKKNKLFGKIESDWVE